MSDSLIPPIMIELGGTAADAIKAITSTVAVFEDLTEASAELAAAVDAVFESIDAGADSFATLAYAAKSARTAMTGVAEAATSVAAAADEAAEAIDTGFAAVSEASAAMAEAVEAASATASEGLAAIGEESQAAGVSVDTMGEDIVASMRAAAVAVAEAAGEIKAAAVEMGAGVEAGAAEAGEASEGLGTKLLGLGEVGGLIKAALPLSIAAIGYESVKAATTFQASTTRLVTSAGEISSNLGMVRSGLLNMSGQVGVSADDLSQAMYYVEAAGFHAGAGLTVLKAAAQGAAAEGADTTTVAQALTDVLVDYHKPAQDAADVTSQMIAAVATGKTNLQDFSAAFASIVPAASAAGISFPDVSAALAEMTNHGFTAQRAATDLAQALRSLLNPTAPMEAAFGEVGLSSTVLRQKLAGPDGLTDAMQYVSQMASKYGKEGTPAYAAMLKELMGTAPGANAALATVGANYAATSAGIRSISAASADAQGNVRGFALVQKNLGQQLKDLKAGFDAVLIRIGTGLIPMLSSLISLVESRATPVLHALGTAVSGIASGFDGSATKATTLPVETTANGLDQHGGGVAAPPPLTGWQQVGQTLKSVAGDIGGFVTAASSLASGLVNNVLPALAKLGGTAVMGALSAVGSVLSNVVTPGLKLLTGLVDQHKSTMQWLVVAFLAPLALRLAALAVIKPVTAIAKLGADIAKFPVSQAKQLGDTMKTTWAKLFGAEAATNAEGEAIPAIEGFFPKVKRIFSTGLGGLQLGWGKLFGTKAITDAEGNVTPAVDGYFQKVSGALGNGWSGLMGGMKSGWASLFGSAATEDAEGNAIPAVEGLFSKIATAAKSGWAMITTGVGAAVTGLQEAKTAMLAFKDSEQLATVATKLQAIAQGALDIVMGADPILLIVIGIGLLVAAFLYCWDHFKGFRDFWIAAWGLIQDAAKGAWDLIKAALDGIGTAAMWLWNNAIMPAVHGISSAFSTLMHAATTAFNWVVSAGETAANWLAALPGKILGWFANAGSWLYNAGASILTGLYNGIVSMGSWVANQVSALIDDIIPGPVRKILGIFSPSRVMHEIGINVTRGLANGITAGSPQVAGASASMATGLVAAGSRAITGASALHAVGSGAAGGGGMQVVNNITIQGTVVSAKQLRDEVQTLMLQLGMRNSQTYQGYRR